MDCLEGIGSCSLIYEVNSAPLDHMGKCFYILNSPIAGTYGLYYAAFGSTEPGISGVGFLIINFNFTIALASSCQVITNSNLNAEIKALSVVLHCDRMDNFNISRIYISSMELSKMIDDGESSTSWISIGAVA